MEHKFYINSRNGYAAMLEQYRAMHEQIGEARFLPNHDMRKGIVYDIKPEYGKGTIQIYNLLGNVMLLIYNFEFYKDIETVFDLAGNYFEIEYCIDGSMYIEEEKAGDTFFEANNLSLSLSQDMKGIIRRCAGQKYQGVSITADRQALSSYFGSTGAGLWNDTIEKLEDQFRSEYYLGLNAPPEIAAAFQQIFNCRLPEKTRTLFYESKVMETLSMIISNEVMKCETCELTALTPYELQKIKEIPQILLEEPFELPSILSLSKKLVINPKKLTKGFKQVYGDTIFSYHRKFSLQQASSMLLNTEKSINEIAYEIGYSSSSNFCAAFKKQYGITPLKYRESSLLRNAE
ncbi:MAG TPA: AraC family transcriptional regulator [Lachnoclostridium sp.]|uniref:helix-turn-helix domain-containing protein n=1 Tax=Lacrimispora sp. TaxID=2719234 RepID=UPI000ECDAC3E|nr:AraC family transcriptional regulator [Lacrimispora sp.]HCD45936.1 AraC family transcriptional regulator [Lachnoclostridium sp.]